MTITTKEAEQLATVHDWTAEDEQTSTGLRAGAKMTSTALRSLAAERDALQAEVERLKAGGCARGQSTTQFCAEAVALQAENARLRAALKECADDLEAEKE
jgi:uncharacterized small protein (DUF1192 family)